MVNTDGSAQPSVANLVDRIGPISSHYTKPTEEALVDTFSIGTNALILVH